MAGNQRPPKLGRHNWLQNIQLDWPALHQLQENTSSTVNQFLAVFNKDVGTIKN